VLLNLLNNAFDAVCDLPKPWVQVEANAVGNHVEISVTDSGSGIPAEIRNRIMQPFFTTKEAGKGTGLGLSISHGIASEHGGKLYIDEQSPHTRFVLVLPSRQEEESRLKKSA
jgi:C4-dicarboxylate-specific signal transduction histidine kinase